MAAEHQAHALDHHDHPSDAAQAQAAHGATTPAGSAASPLDGAASEMDCEMNRPLCTALCLILEALALMALLLWASAACISKKGEMLLPAAAQFITTCLNHCLISN